jgi:hypothetical protein
MLKHVLFASAALALLAVPSMAAESSTTTIQASVTPTCSAMASTATTLPVSNLTDTNGVAKSQALTFPSPLAGVWCNGNNNKVDVTATKLTNKNTSLADDSDFTTAVDFVMAQTALGPALNTATDLSGSNTIPAIVIAPATTGTLTITAGTKKLFAGDYEATVTVTLTPGNS